MIHLGHRDKSACCRSFVIIFIKYNKSWVVHHSISVPLDQGGFGGWNLMLTVQRFGNKLNEEVCHGFISANLFNSLYLLVRLLWNVVVANLATNFQDLVAKVKNLVALAPVLGAISRPAVSRNLWRRTLDMQVKCKQLNNETISYKGFLFFPRVHEMYFISPSVFGVLHANINVRIITSSLI